MRAFRSSSIIVTRLLRSAIRTVPRPTSRTPWFALVAAVLMLLPLVGAASSPTDVFGSGTGAVHGTTPAAFAYPSHLYDDPGLPYGYPDRDTFGYTVESVNESRWIDHSSDELTSGANILVEMGDFNRMHMTDLSSNYWADVVFDARVRLWADGDGRYEPNWSYTAPTSGGAGGPMSPAPVHQACARAVDGSSPPCIGPDDPCPDGDFAIMDIYAGTTLAPTNQDVLVRTVYGGDMTNCAGANATEDHAFIIRPDPLYPNEPAGRFHIPNYLMGTGSAPAKECFVRLRFVPRNLTLPHYAPDHNASEHGVAINITSVMVQLVAPPMVINHGYSAFFNPATEVLPNQHDLKNNLREAMKQNFGQDPWDWASSMPEGGIYLNSYDRKQDFRVSAAELSTKVLQQYHAHWSGKVWMHGQSMGGLTTRYYIEQLGGAQHVEKLAQTATPNTGSFEPVILNILMQNFYSQNDAGPNTRLGIFVPPLLCFMPSVFVGWKPWWIGPPGNVFTYHCGFPAGRSRMADFELRPAGNLNPILSQMNAAFFPQRAAGTLPPYFSVRAQLEVTPGFDEAVSFSSASLNGAIPHRSIKSAHEDTPSQPQTAVYFSRFLSDLNLDNAYPKWCMPHVTRTPHNITSPVNPGDTADANAGPDHVGTLAENMTLELFNATKGVIEFNNETDDFPTSSSGSVLPPRIANPHVLIVIDAKERARIAIHTAFEYRALDLSLIGPDGGSVKAEYREEVGGWTRVQVFTIDHPAQGTYELVIGPTAYATPYALIGSWSSDHVLSLRTDKAEYASREPVTVRATLTGIGAASTVNVIAHVPTADGIVELPLVNEKGAYTGVWRDAWAPGIYSLFVTAEGSSQSGRFVRNLTLPVLVNGNATMPTPPTDKPASPAATDGDSAPIRTPDPETTDATGGANTTRPEKTPAPTSNATSKRTPGHSTFALLGSIAALALALSNRRKR